MKAASEFVLSLLILIILVSLVTLLWLYSYGYLRFIERKGDTNSLGDALSSCIKIESFSANKIFLKNCGTGLIKNSTLAIFADEEPLVFSSSQESVGQGGVMEIDLRGLSGLSIGNHKIRITTNSASDERQARASLQDSTAISMDFDEGSGINVQDSSNYGNSGLFTNYTPPTGYPVDSQGYIRDRLIIKSFSETDCACDSGTCDSFISETSNNKYIGLVENGRTWTENHSSRTYDFPDQQAVFYAFATIYSPSARNAQLRIGSDDGVKAWVNGVLVDNNGFACRGVVADNDIVGVTLNQGYNYLMLRVGNAGGPGGLRFRITDMSGNPMTDLQVYLERVGMEWATGKSGNAVQFYGTGSYVNILNSPSLQITGDLTISMWLYPTSLSTDMVVLDKSYSGEYFLKIMSNGELRFAHGAPGNNEELTILPSGSITTNSWTNIIVIRNTTSHQIVAYKDGVTYPPVAYTKTPTASSENLMIGIEDSYYNPFNGIIDSLRIFNSTMGADQIVRLTTLEMSLAT